MEYKKGRK